MQRLIICRHAESVFNARGVLNGDRSIPGGLTDRGRAQARALGRSLADDVIDLCVTTGFERTIETAAIALEGRDIPRAVMPELDDPPNGIFELQPAEELRAWRDEHGPDVEIPGTGRSERTWVERLRSGLELLSERPEAGIVAVLHGWSVAWLLASAGEASDRQSEQAVPHRMTADAVARALEATADDVYARYGLA